MEFTKLEGVFQVEKKYTLFRIGEMIAITVKQEIQITRFIDGNPVYKLKGKRKEAILKLETKSYTSAPFKSFEGAVFEGWKQPITCDTDSGMCYRENACYNFVGTPENIRLWIDKRQLNPYFKKSHVLAVNNDGTHTKEVVVYPELYQGGHAVIERMLQQV